MWGTLGHAMCQQAMDSLGGGLFGVLHARVVACGRCCGWWTCGVGSRPQSGVQLCRGARPAASPLLLLGKPRRADTFRPQLAGIYQGCNEGKETERPITDSSIFYRPNKTNQGRKSTNP